MFKFNFLMISAAVGALSHASASTFYTAEELSAPYDWTYILPTALNDNGEVVGIGSARKEAYDVKLYNALYWPAPKTVEVLKNYQNVISAYSTAYDINNNGSIVGEIKIPESDNSIVGAVWERGQLSKSIKIIYASLPMTEATTFNGINEDNVIAGKVKLTDGTEVAFMSGLSGYQRILGPENYINVRSVNDNKIVFGQFGSAGFTYNAKKTNPLSIFNSVGYNIVADVNNYDVQVEQQNNYCIIRGDAITEFGDGLVECSPRAISDSGQVVGTSRKFGVENDPYRAFIIDENFNDECSSNYRDLNTLVAFGNKEVVLKEAVDINNYGQILAVGVVNGETKPFLLTPSSEGEVMPYELDNDRDGILDACDDDIAQIDTMAWLIPVLYLLQ